MEFGERFKAFEMYTVIYRFFVNVIRVCGKSSINITISAKEDCIQPTTTGGNVKRI